MYLELILITLIPIVIALGLYFIDIKFNFFKLPYWPKQIIIGVIFGAVAVAGTEFGVPLNGSTANVRDAGPILASFLFGGPAGIIAGCIGGVERFVSVLWSDAYFTQWACSISTILAGVISALLRKHMFEGRRPSFGFAIIIGSVIEVFHFTMVFITNINESVRAMEVIKVLAGPMIVANAVAVAVPLGVIQLINKKAEYDAANKRKLSNQIKWWLLGSIFTCYVLTTTITFTVETSTAYQKAESTFSLTIQDIESDVNENSKRIVEGVLDEVYHRYLEHPYQKDITPEELLELRQYYHSLCEEIGVYSIDVVAKDSVGSFVCSSDLGFELGTFYMMLQDADQSNELHTIMTDGKHEMYIQDFGKRGDEQAGVVKLKYAAQSLNDDYYLIVGISEENFKNMINDIIIAITQFRHVGTYGHVLILDENDNRVSDSINYDAKDTDITYKKLVEQGKEYESIRGYLYDEDCFYTYTTAETYTIIVILPYDEVLGDRDSSFMLNSFMQVLTYAILYGLIYALVRNLVVRKLQNVNKDLTKIIDGDLNVKVTQTSCLEFEKLSNDINYTVDSLKSYIEAEKKRIDDELSFAKAIQASALPSTFPAFPDKTEFDIFATMNTAKQVGGDFYDFYIIDNDNLAFLIADVSGKGIPAAMFMMESKALLKNLAKTLESPEKVLYKTNDGLSQNNDANMFVTCWFGVLNFKTGHVSFANAGHNNPLIYKKNGKWSYIPHKRNMVLAALEGSPYELQEFDMEPGDRLYLYTDGVTEANNLERKLYGEKRLENYLNENKNSTLKELLLGIKSDIDKFAEGADQFDDITMLILEYKGK